jgi:uncharacterized Tic20 family protein
VKDKLGVFFSGLCVIHCFAITLVLFLGGADYLNFLVSTDYLVHPLLLIIVVTIGVFSFPSAYKKHKNKNPIILGFLGSIILFTALLSSNMYEIVFTILGGITLINAHLWNYNLSN